ncbi:small ribosomal subunit protein bS18m-like [Littorina saxatilis]|uniref:Uncharacterized protein n=1 Tax=Littorina saxatilis TaxID=31220 RepID=A0AAN9BQJ3_9CAEN
MAAPCNLLRSVGSKVLAYSRLTRDRPVTVLSSQWRRLPVACTGQRFQHSESSSPTETAGSTAAEAEKARIVIDNNLISKLLKDMEDNQPVSSMPDPFQKAHKKCILCQYNLDVNYKNVRLLSQFVSPYTGRIYGRAVTGLCIPMQKQVARAVKQSRVAGYMPYMFKKSEYLKDPRLFDPFKPAK